MGCIEHSHCGDPKAAKCEAGQCVACTESPNCAGIANASVCEAGACVQCALSDESACASPKSCDLLTKQCVDVAPGSVKNCTSCSNDAQCLQDHRCIAMDFDKKAHGYYCLKDKVAGGCAQPFLVLLNKPSLSGAAAAKYCSIDQDLASCEAVQALLLNWRCSGKDGMCSPDGVAPEVPVAGALCKEVGGLTNRCSYACGSPAQCLSAPPGNTCGKGMGNDPPGWCGG